MVRPPMMTFERSPSTTAKCDCSAHNGVAADKHIDHGFFSQKHKATRYVAHMLLYLDAIKASPS